MGTIKSIIHNKDLRNRILITIAILIVYRIGAYIPIPGIPATSIMNEYQNRGIGRMMLEYLLEKGRNAGVEAFILEVRKSNENAIHLYEKLGFVTEGIRKNFYEKPVEDGLIMWKRVKQQLENSDYN